MIHTDNSRHPLAAKRHVAAGKNMRRFLDLAAFSVTLAVSGLAWAEDGTGGCADVVSRSAQLNASQLFDAAPACAAEKRSFDVTLQVIEGQIRAMADMEMLAAKTDQDQLLGAKLYGKIFYTFGGAGDPNLYRDPAKTDALFQRIESWMPAFPTDYDPGWQYKKRPTEEAYGDSVKYAKAYRLAQLRSYAAETELTRIQARSPRGIDTTSSDGKRAQELSALMNKISQGMPPPVFPRERPFVYTPDPDADFKQILVGFNGPERAGMTILRSESEVAASWVASTISPDDLKKLTAQVSFDSQVLVAFAMGERDTATGQVFVTNASYNALINSFTVAARVGVNEAPCAFERRKSYPFALVVAPRPSKATGGSGYDVGNFGDGGKQPQSGVPSISPTLNAQ
jgi:hypothetical protein